jgi:hypothetical protein
MWETLFLEMAGVLTLRKCVPLLIVLVTILFFFPVAVGSYQATHGPTSTLREYLTSILLQTLFVLVALISLLFAVNWTESHFEMAEGAVPSTSSAALLSLRC